jgi:tetratricopeptide (TPR) repeat protein
MRRILVGGLIGGFAALALAAGLTVPARAQLHNAVEVCGDLKAEPRDLVRFCRMALDTGKLEPLAAAQVNANLGVGYFELGRYADAVDAYTAAIADAPRMVAPYVNRARAYERLRRPDEAAADYGEAIGLDPDAADAYLGRGVLLLRHGQTQAAIEDFTAAIRTEPDWIAPRFNRGVAYLDTGAHAEAARDFAEVLRRNPEDAAAWVNRGRALAAAGDPDAKAHFDAAIRLDPEWSGAWFARGKYHDAEGAREAANADFLRAYELGYADPWLIQRVREISG